MARYTLLVKIDGGEASIRTDESDKCFRDWYDSRDQENWMPNCELYTVAAFNQDEREIESLLGQYIKGKFIVNEVLSEKNKRTRG